MRISHVGFALPSGTLNDSLLEMLSALNTLRKYQIINRNGYITKIVKMYSLRIMSMIYSNSFINVVDDSFTA